MKRVGSLSSFWLAFRGSLCDRRSAFLVIPLPKVGPQPTFFYGFLVGPMAAELSVRVTEIIEQCADSLGYEIIDIRWGGAQQGRTLSVMIDRPEGVGLRDCETFSRELGDHLDSDDWGLGNYRLEISSPGLERPLKTLQHFEKYCGHKVRIETHQPLDGRRRYRGSLARVEGHNITIVSEGQEILIPFETIKKAHLIYEGQ